METATKILPDFFFLLKRLRKLIHCNGRGILRKTFDRLKSIVQMNFCQIRTDTQRYPGFSVKISISLFNIFMCAKTSIFFVLTVTFLRNFAASFNNQHKPCPFTLLQKMLLALNIYYINVFQIDENPMNIKFKRIHCHDLQPLKPDLSFNQATSYTVNFKWR